MSVLRRIFGIEDNKSNGLHGHEQKAIATDAHLERERQEYRQTIQRVESGARVLERKNRLISTWDEGLQMIARKNDG